MEESLHWASLPFQLLSCLFFPPSLRMDCALSSPHGRGRDYSLDRAAPAVPWGAFLRQLGVQCRVVVWLACDRPMSCLGWAGVFLWVHRCGYGRIPDMATEIDQREGTQAA